jgi:MbtH protein
MMRDIMSAIASEKHMFLDTDETAVYVVVVNHEEQYSIWPEAREVPSGWAPVGKKGLKSECLDYIDHVWTDMRPLSVRPNVPTSVN